jgi:predicted ATPase
MCHSFAARTLWYQGYPEQGLARSQAALILAQQSPHPFSLGHALYAATTFHHCRREVQLTQERADALISLATDQGFPQWQAGGALLRGWTLVQQGQVNEGIAQMHESLRAFRTTGAEISRPYYLALLAEAYGMRGQPEAGLTALTEARTLAETTGERWYHAELWRLQGELLLQGSAEQAPAAATCFQHAMAIAHNQQAKSLELRASTSLARLWQQQGKRREAAALLAPIYGWFTEGFETADLQEAKGLLEELGG